jgi:PAS domain S-box-containing protein
LDAKGPQVIHQDYTDAPLVLWARDPANRGQIILGPLEVQEQNGLKAPMFTMATPLYEESVDESHPKATGKLDGVLLFKIDASKFAGYYCAGIRSGRTGYCWVMDKQGVFLYHPEREFIGEDAFTARGRRNPAISFDQINEIQKSKMLTGEEGAATYFSGWHRGIIKPMEKFVAFTHANVEVDQARFWPVAVVAPTDEVYGTIHSLYVRQFLIQGILIFALLLAAIAVIYYEMRWGVELRREVDRTTVDLRRSREQYKSLVENARDFIFSINDKGTFISANTATARAFGIPAAAMAGKNLETLLPPEDAEAFIAQVNWVFTSHQGSEIKTTVLIRNRPYWLSIHFVPLFGEDGRTVERVLVMARDITERHRMEEQMFQTEKLASLGTLSAGVAHEINNPVGIILGFTELLLDRLQPDSKEHEMLKTIERQGLNAKRIVEKLMTYARQPSKQEEFTDINQDIDMVANLVKNNLLTKKIELELRLAKGIGRVRGDSGELQQVFLNLINNAAAAMPDGGRLTLITRINPYSHMVEAICADTGVGIPREYRDRIFDPFFTTKKAGEGTGLGLAVSYAIVNKYGGNIRFESKTAEEPPGEQHGTTFFVSLPTDIPKAGANNAAAVGKSFY